MKKISLLLIIATPLLFSGCYKTTFDTPEIETPNTSILVDIINNDLDEGESAPISYIGSWEGLEYPIVSGVEYQYSGEFTSGSYQAYVYNSADGITISNTFDSDGMILIAPTVTNGMVFSNPNTIYYGTKSVEIIAETSNYAEVEVKRIMKRLQIIFDIIGDAADRVESVVATLSGVSQSWDLIADEPYGASASVAMNCEDITNYTLLSWAKLVGVDSSDSKILTVVITYKDDYPSSETKTFDLSSDLADFNLNKSTTATIYLTLETANKLYGEGSENGWDDEYGDDLEAR